MADAERKGARIEKELERHPAVKEIRRSGLLIAVDLGSEDRASAILGHLIEEGAVSDYFLFNPTSFRIAPPLCISDDEVSLAIDIVRKALDRLKV